MSTRLAKRSVPMFLAATLDVGYSTFGVGRCLQFNPKKYRPPRPMGVKGGCSPQNNLTKSGQLLPDLKRCCNKNFYKYTALPRAAGNQALDHEDVDLGRPCVWRWLREESPNTCGTVR